MAERKRNVRVGESIREVLAEQLVRGLKTPGVGFCTITGVDVTPDLREARVFVSVYGSEAEMKSTMDALGRASGYLRHEVAKALRTKVIPLIQFKQDISVERGARMSLAITQARAADEKLARDRGDLPAKTEGTHGQDTAAPGTPDRAPNPAGNEKK